MKPKPCVVVFVKDVARMARFYARVASMTIVHAARDNAILDIDGLQVVIHGIPAAIAASIKITKPPRRRDQNPVKLCLPVASIKAARASAAKLGGRIGPKRTEWEARGFRACDGYDPEGNVFQVREAAQ